MTEVQIQDFARANFVDVIKRPGFVIRPITHDEALRLTRVAGLKQVMQLAVNGAEIEFIVGIELFDSRHQRMRWVGNPHMERLDRWMGNELRTEGLHHHRRQRGAVNAAFDKPQDGVGAMQREPTLA